MSGNNSVKNHRLQYDQVLNRNLSTTNHGHRQHFRIDPTSMLISQIQVRNKPMQKGHYQMLQELEQT